VRRITALLFAAVALAGTSVTGFLLTASAAAEGAIYTPEAPMVDTISGGPWNTSQGNPAAGGEYASSDLLPLFAFGGAETTLGGVSEPNLAVYPGEQKVTENGKEVTKLIPYPSGVAGTPGPLSGYCSTEASENEKGTPVAQPPDSTLPFSPYYFPDVVRNADGSLTGYFDYRPKDADEAITVARSTDNGKTWVAEGKALEQNPGYCPTADTNDDGQGHPYVGAIGGSAKLYTLQRPAGDYEGVGLLVHNVEPSAADPLAALPASESVGIDPNTFAGEEVSVPPSGEAGVSIPVSTLGEASSPEHIVAGPYEDYNAASPATSVITCTGTSSAPASLTGCTVAGATALTVKANDDLVQVIATANPEEVGGKKPAKGATYTIPVGPNKTSGEGGLEKLSFLNGNSVVSPLTTFILNENAPNRVYIDGDTVYCAQSNANPTTKIENCTTTSGSPLVVHQGDAITADPIIPPQAQVTTGLKSPDGIVGTLRSYPGAPGGSTVVLYTEKILAYFIVGTTNGAVSGSTFKAGTIALPASTINYTPSVHPSEPLPSTGSFKIYLGTEVGKPIQEVTCTGNTPALQTGVPNGSYDLTGCSGGEGSVKEGNWVGGPNAAIAPLSTLEKIGEGKNSPSKGPEKLFANNEDYTVLRAAYTENGINFTDLGPVSGTASETGNDTGEYNDLSNPYQQSSPSNSEPTSPAPGSLDMTELRFIGSRGTIITNPDGSYGMFLSGSWATDGDSDAFNQIFYTTSTNGKEWSVPKVVLSTDYSFSASREQDEALEHGEDKPLGVSAYYSGRAYGPAVVQNPDGSLTMVFSGYRIPKPVTTAGAKLGTNPLAQYVVGAKDPALYRNILTMHLALEEAPKITSANSATFKEGTEGSFVVTAVGPPAPTIAEVGTLPEGVTFDASTNTLAGTPTQEGVYPISFIATNGVGFTTQSFTLTVDAPPAITSADEATFDDDASSSFAVTATGTPAPTIAKWGNLPEGVTFSGGVLTGTPTQKGTFEITFTAHNGVGADSTQQFTLTVVGLHVTSSSLPAITPGVPYSQQLTAAGGVPPYRWAKVSGSLPKGLTLSSTGLLSGKTGPKTYPQGGSFPITVKVTDATKKVHQVATANLTLVVS
jgi:hypothetical protein